jgi:hypothetical protein
MRSTALYVVGIAMGQNAVTDESFRYTLEN